MVLRRATTEECAAAEMIAKDATLTADQKNYEDRTKNPEAAGPPVIPVATPADDEEVYERRDYNMKRFVMSQAGGPNRNESRAERFLTWRPVGDWIIESCTACRVKSCAQSCLRESGTP